MTGWAIQASTGVVVAVAAGVAAVIYLLKVAYRMVRQCLAFFTRLEKVVQNVEAQLYPNGGLSLRDQTNRIETAQQVMRHQIDAIEMRETP